MSRSPSSSQPGGIPSRKHHGPLRNPENQERIEKIPPAVVRRLSLYSRVLTALEMNNVEKISSKELAEHLGLNSAQVRKDLALSLIHI